MRVRFEQAVRRAQDEICKAVTELDGKGFHEDAWTRPGGGGGVSRVLQVLHLLTCLYGLLQCSHLSFNPTPIFACSLMHPSAQSFISSVRCHSYLLCVLMDGTDFVSRANLYTLKQRVMLC